MSKGWNKGFNKNTHPSVLKISETMKRRKIDNFKEWRDEMRKLGKIKSKYPEYKKNGDLAELIGVVLGDGNIQAFPRTERLLIAANSNNKGFVKRYSNLVRAVIQKEPTVIKAKNVKCVRISVYEKYISKRLGIPTGARKNISIEVPNWILENENNILRYLRGLYEAEGSFCVHKATSTYKFLFSNRNGSLIHIVERLLKRLNFHPHISSNKVQISKKAEVYKALNLLQFRKYS